MSLNLDRQLPVEHVKLEVGVEVVGQPLPLRLLETRKPSRTNFISCVQLIVFITTRRTTLRRNLCSSPSFVKTLTPHAPASLCQFTISMSEPCQMSFSLDFNQKTCHLDNILPARLAMLEDHLGVGDPQVAPHHRPPHLSTDAGILKKIHLNSEIRVWKKIQSSCDRDRKSVV